MRATRSSSSVAIPRSLCYAVPTLIFFTCQATAAVEYHSGYNIDYDESHKPDRNTVFCPVG